MYNLHRDKVIIFTYYIAAALSVAAGVMFIKNELFDIVLSLVFFKKFSTLPALAYVLCNLLVLFIPLLMLVPTTYFPRGFLLKKVLFSISFCYLLGNTWLIYAFVSSPEMLFSGDITAYYQFQYDNALIFNYRTWLIYSPWASILSLIQSALFYFMAKTVSDKKNTFSLLLTISTVLSILVPFIFSGLFLETFSKIPSLFTGQSAESVSSVFFENILDLRFYRNQAGYFISNRFMMFSQIGTWAIFFAISKSRQLWVKYLWVV